MTELEQLPKALTHDDRVDLQSDELGIRALALIDALTAHLAEAVARMTVAEKKVDTLEEGRAVFAQATLQAAAEQVSSERDATLARAEAANIETANMKDHWHNACDVGRRYKSDAAALRAENERLEGLCSLRDATERENAALSAENERLRSALNHIGQCTTAATREFIARTLRAGQPAVPPAPKA